MKAIQYLITAAAMCGVLWFFGWDHASASTEIAGEIPAATDVTQTEFDRSPGWHIDADGTIRYRDANGDPVTGVQEIGGLPYRFSPDGVLYTEWQTIEGKRYYYDPQTGRLRAGWLFWQDNWYYITLGSGKQTGRLTPGYLCTGHICKPDRFVLADSYGAMLTGHFRYSDGNLYYAAEDGQVETGDVELTDGWYRFDENGVQQTGWQTIRNKPYYFYPETGEKPAGMVSLDSAWYFFETDGSMYTGWRLYGGERYYFSPENGTAQTGWLTVNGDTYYLHPSTMRAVLGLRKIEGSYYYFDEQYHLVKNDMVQVGGVVYSADADGVLTRSTHGTGSSGDENGLFLCGRSQATAEQMTAYIRSVNPAVPQSVIEMIPYYLSEGEAEGIRGDIAFAQSCLETGNFAFRGSAVTLHQNNFCGLGVTSNGMRGNSFATPQLGIRAQIQHLKAYANTDPLNQAQIDPRFGYVVRGCAPYVEWLGMQENPTGRGWAAGAGYGNAILRILTQILAM